MSQFRQLGLCWHTEGVDKVMGFYDIDTAEMVGRDKQLITKQDFKKFRKGQRRSSQQVKGRNLAKNLLARMDSKGRVLK